MEAVHSECRLTFRSNLRLLNLAHFDSFSSNWPNRKKEHFSPESSYSCRQAAFLIEKLQHCRVGIERVYSCLFVCLWKKKEKEIFSPGAEQFPKHIWSVFLKWLAPICECVFVCVAQLQFVDDAVTAAGILDAFRSLSRKRRGTIYLFLIASLTQIRPSTHSYA